jgi:hypothetical protein
MFGYSKRRYSKLLGKRPPFSSSLVFPVPLLIVHSAIPECYRTSRSCLPSN